MPDYQKSKIYKLVSDHTDEIYIGSTIQSLSQRLSGHARDVKVKKTPCNSKKLFELGKVKIILIENYSCNSKEELLKHERHYIETMVCVNKNIPGRTDAEYRHNNKDKIKERNKEYRLKNKDKMKERRKVKITCDCGADINKDSIYRHKRTKKHLDLMGSKTHLPTPSNLE